MGILILRSAAQVESSAFTTSILGDWTDNSGTLHREEDVEGATVTGYAPFTLNLDCTGTRSQAANCDTSGGANKYIGMRTNWGESLGTTWSISGQSKDEDVGALIAAHTYETPGTYTVRVRFKDPDDNQTTKQLTVEVLDPASFLTVVNRATSAGSWPALSSGTLLNLTTSGGDYTGFGDLNIAGLSNVIIVGTGNPTIATFRPESRSNRVDSAQTRSRGIRIKGVDIAEFAYGGYGFDDCTCVNGRVRAYTYPGIPGMWIDAATNTATIANNFRWAWGAMFWNTGQMNQSATPYVIADDPIRGIHFYGCSLVKTGGSTGSHTLRYAAYKSILRHNLIDNTVNNTFGWAKMGGWCDEARNTTDHTQHDWDANSRIGTYGDSHARSVPLRHLAMAYNQFGSASSGTGGTRAAPSASPQNDLSSEADEGVDECWYEDNLFYAADSSELDFTSINLGGRNLRATNNRYDLGAGALVSVSTSSSSNRIPADWDTGYETTTNRPIPDAF